MKKFLLVSCILILANATKQPSISTPDLPLDTKDEIDKQLDQLREWTEQFNANSLKNYAGQLM